MTNAMLLARTLFAAGFLALVCGFEASSGGSSRVFVSTPVAKNPKRTVEDCMTPCLLTLTPNTSIDETMALLLQNGLSGAPVVSNDNELLGMVSSYDFLQKEAFQGALLPIAGSREDVEAYAQAAQKICAQKVGEIMTQNPITVEASLPMDRAAALMAEHNIQRLPVVESGKSGLLVGMLTSMDVMRDLLHTVRNLPSAKEDESFKP